MIGNVGESTFHAASFIELLHTASLIHDDVVDTSYERRGFFSINALWQSKVAVLIGDYLLAKGLLLAVDNQEYDLLNIVSNAVREMSEGELLQIHKSRKLNILTVKLKPKSKIKILNPNTSKIQKILEENSLLPFSKREINMQEQKNIKKQ